MLLALSISSIESIQAFIFYITQYSLSNLNIFIILITIGFSLICYNNSNIEQMKLMDKKNSPIQLISQLKGYFYINPVLSLSLAITIFSFIGIPPLIGFFGKQMVLSAALDQGYFFLVLIAILTSVISAVYYLTLIKEMFFYSSEYKENTFLLSKLPQFNSNNLENTRSRNIIISSPFAFTISIITLIILLFIFVNKE
jgi:NADH-ubiquinone oxidoreductase chain 2